MRRFRASKFSFRRVSRSHLVSSSFKFSRHFSSSSSESIAKATCPNSLNSTTENSTLFQLTCAHEQQYRKCFALIDEKQQDVYWKLNTLGKKYDHIEKKIQALDTRTLAIQHHIRCIDFQQMSQTLIKQEKEISQLHQNSIEDKEMLKIFHRVDKINQRWMICLCFSVLSLNSIYLITKFI